MPTVAKTRGLALARLTVLEVVGWRTMGSFRWTVRRDWMLGPGWWLVWTSCWNAGGFECSVYRRHVSAGVSHFRNKPNSRFANGRIPVTGKATPSFRNYRCVLLAWAKGLKVIVRGWNKAASNWKWKLKSKIFLSRWQRKNWKMARNNLQGYDRADVETGLELWIERNGAEFSLLVMNCMFAMKGCANASQICWRIWQV